MSKIYEALKHAERERSAEQGDAVGRLLKRAAEERDILRAEISACQERLAALATRVDAAPAIDPAAIDDLGRRVGQLAAQHERLATEPRQLLESALQRFTEELTRRNATLQSQSEALAGVSLRLVEVEAGVGPAIETIRHEMDELRSHGEEQQRAEQTKRHALAATLAQARDETARATAAVGEWQREQRRLLETELAAVRGAQEDAAQQTQRLSEEAYAVATSVGQRVDELAALESKLEALSAQQQQTHERIDRAVESLGAAVQDVCSRVDDLGHQSEQTRNSVQADAASVRQQLGEALRGRNNRLAQLAHDVQTAHSDQQLVLAELRQQMAAMDVLHTHSRSELRELVESAGDRASAALRRLESLDGGLQNHDALLGRFETAQAELNTLVQRSEMRIGELAGQTARAVDEQALRSEALGASLESVRTRLADAEAARSEAARRWQEDLDRVRAALSESNAALVSADTGRVEEVWTGLAVVRERLASADDEYRRLQQRWEEQLAEQRQALSSLSAEAIRIAEGYWSESREAQQDMAARLAAAEEAQADTDRRLSSAVDAMQAALAGQQQSTGALDALRAQVAPLADAQARLQECSEGVGRAQATADEAARRIAAIDGTQAASLATLRQQLAALQADSASGRDTLDAVQSSLAAQQQSAGALDALRAQVASLADAQARLQESSDGVGRAQATADEAARRIAAIDGTQAASLATLRQQLAALQADRASGRDTLDAVQSSLAAQQQSAGALDALRAQVASLADAQARLQESSDGVGRAQATADETARRVAAIDGAQTASLAVLRAQVAPLADAPARLQECSDGVGRAQATADETARRVAAIDGAQAAGLAALRQQVAALQADSASLRNALAAVQSSLATQQQSVDKMVARRAQVVPLADAQTRLQEFSDGVARAQATADEALDRVAAVDGARAASLAALRQQVAALQADRESERDGRSARSHQTVDAEESPHATRPLSWPWARAALLASIAVIGSALVLFLFSGSEPLSTLIQGLNP